MQWEYEPAWVTFLQGSVLIWLYSQKGDPALWLSSQTEVCLDSTGIVKSSVLSEDQSLQKLCELVYMVGIHHEHYRAHL